MSPGRIVCVTCLALLGNGSTLRAQQQAPIEFVAWLAGCWEASIGEASMEEQWTSPRGGIMLGVNRTVRNGRLVAYEFLLLDGRDTTLTYVAHPSGQSAAAFRAESIAADRAVFSNPSHDFPQRIGYARLARDSLLAWIAGVSDGERRRAEFPFARVACRTP